MDNFTSVSQVIAILSRRGVSQAAIILYLTLRDLAEDGRVTFSSRDFEELINRSRRTFQGTLSELYDLNLVSRVGQTTLRVHEIPPLTDSEQMQVIAECGATLRRLLVMFIMFGSSIKTIKDEVAVTYEQNLRQKREIYKLSTKQSNRFRKPHRIQKTE